MCHLRGRFKVSSGAFKAGAAIRAAGQSALLTLVDNNTDNNNKNHHHRCVFFLRFHAVHRRFPALSVTLGRVCEGPG